MTEATHIEAIDAEGLAERLAAGRRPALVDVREAEEVAAGTLPGAHHLPLGEVVARAHEVPREGPVVVFCQRGVRSARAIAALAPLGFTNLINLEGGFSAWLARGAGEGGGEP